MSQPTNWKSHPFTVDGVEFVSLIRPNSEFDLKVSMIPASVFAQMNVGAIREFIGEVSIYTKSEIQEMLDKVNAGYHSAFIALA